MIALQRREVVQERPFEGRGERVESAGLQPLWSSSCSPTQNGTQGLKASSNGAPNAALERPLFHVVRRDAFHGGGCSHEDAFRPSDEIPTAGSSVAQNTRSVGMTNQERGRANRPVPARAKPGGQECPPHTGKTSCSRWCCRNCRICSNCRFWS